MSWDIFVQDFPAVATVEEIPDDFVPRSVGTRDVMIGKITQALPAADFSDPAWGLIEGPDWSIEVNLGEGDECEGFALHVRGSSDDVVSAVIRILDHVQLRAIDSATGEFFDPATAQSSFEQWRRYRDQIAGSAPSTSEPPKSKGLFRRLFGFS